MGWLGEVFRSIGHAIGCGIEKVGDFLRIDKLSDLGIDIQSACAEKIGEEVSYKKEEADIYLTDRLNEILVSFTDGYYKQVTAIEKNCIKIVEEFYDNLIQIIENAPAISYNRSNIKALKKGRSRIRQTIAGSIKEHLSKKMSLDNSECLKILKMDAGTEKTKAMSAFSQNVIAEALNNISRKVRDSMDEQFEDIGDYLKNVSEQQEKEFSKLKAQFEKMSVDGAVEAGERERHCIEPLLIINAVDMINDIL